MSKGAFVIGLVVWLGLFCVGVYWSFGPHRRLIGEAMASIVREDHGDEEGGIGICMCALGDMPPSTLAEARSQWPIHLASFENSHIARYSERIENEDDRLPDEFDSEDWAFREVRARGALFLILWLASGFIVHWFVGQVIRNKQLLDLD
jgi:hypothetical protein